ncbi:MAG: DUF3179 domain-containing protein [Calditrichaeota bacterium]|nr:MAG: DUF3179 domain-containing protein [Calditrichota bacterium]
MKVRTNFVVFLAVLCLSFALRAQTSQSTQDHKPPKKVKGYMQARPGGPMEEVEVGVHEVPVDLPMVSADQAPLQEDDLVLGVVRDGQAVAFPIRFLAMFEVVDSRVGKTPVAPTW